MLARSKLLLKIKGARDRFAALSIVLGRGDRKGRREPALVGVARSNPAGINPAGPSPPGPGKALRWHLYFI